MLNSLIIRAAAGGTLMVGGALFALQSGLPSGVGNAQARTETRTVTEERTLTSSSRPSEMASMTPSMPEIVTGSDVRLPAALEAVAPEAMLVPAGFAELSGPDAAPLFAAPAMPDDLSDLGLPCDVTVTASAMPAAMVALDILAPCRANAEVAIEHSGLLIAASTDGLGLLTLDIPAFATPAQISVTFDDGVGDTVSVAVPDLAEFDRIGLTWRDDLGLELHAMEFGATYGGPGHVWQNAPSSPEMASAGEGGFLTRLGSGEGFAQIYTLPRATLRQGETVRLSIDAPVTAANCTRPVVARTLRAEAGGPVDVTELTFTLPDCGAVGDVLVLQNLLEDLRLASN